MPPTGFRCTRGTAILRFVASGGRFIGYPTGIVSPHWFLRGQGKQHLHRNRCVSEARADLLRVRSGEGSTKSFVSASSTTGERGETMSDKVKELQKQLARFEQTPESYGLDLRLDLADIVLRGLRERGWTQKQLAQKVGMKESFVSRIIHANANCTFDVAGRILVAFENRPRLATVQATEAVTASISDKVQQVLDYPEFPSQRSQGLIYHGQVQKNISCQCYQDGPRTTAPIH